MGRDSMRTLRGAGETLDKVPQVACVRLVRVRGHVLQAAACCTSKDAGNVGHPLARLRRVAPDWLAVSISGSPVKSHDGIDSRSTDMFVSQQAQNTAYVRYCFISLVFTCRFFKPLSSLCPITTKVLSVTSSSLNLRLLSSTLAWREQKTY